MLKVPFRGDSPLVIESSGMPRSRGWNWPCCLAAIALCALVAALPPAFAADDHSNHMMGAEQQDKKTPAPAPGPGGTNGFAVNGTAPAGVPIASNAGAKGVAPPPIVERLGKVVPEGIMLRDENGAPVDVRSLMDIPTIILPVFFTCPAACNTLQSSMAATLPQVNLVPGKDFRVLTVSFDENDTPATALRKKENFLAAMNYKFPASEYRYLTGDQASIKEFMDSLGFPYIRLGPGNFSHPIAAIVLAPGGKVVRYLYGQGFMPFDITMAVHEAAEGKVGVSITRVLSYCFAYDPAARGYVFSFMRVAGLIILFGAGVFLFILLRGGKKEKKV